MQGSCHSLQGGAYPKALQPQEAAPVHEPSDQAAGRRDQRPFASTPQKLSSHNVEKHLLHAAKWKDGSRTEMFWMESLVAQGATSETSSPCCSSALLRQRRSSMQVPGKAGLAYAVPLVLCACSIACPLVAGPTWKKYCVKHANVSPYGPEAMPKLTQHTEAYGHQVPERQATEALCKPDTPHSLACRAAKPHLLRHPGEGCRDPAGRERERAELFTPGLPAGGSAHATVPAAQLQGPAV